MQVISPSIRSKHRIPTDSEHSYGQIDAISIIVESPSITDYEFFMPFGGHVYELVAKTSSGSVVGTVSINGAPIVGMENVSIGTTRSTYLSAGNVSFTAGQLVTFSISSASTPSNLEVTIAYRRDTLRPVEELIKQIDDGEVSIGINGLDVNGTVTATKFKGDGSELTGLSTAEISSAIAYSIQRENHTGFQPISSVSGLQTSLNTKSSIGHTHAFSSITSKPDTLAGYGINDAIALLDSSNVFTGGIQTLAVRDKGGQVFNIKAYGGVADNSTDNTAAFNAAIAALPASGGIIYFPGTGIYRGNFLITRGGVTLQGDGSANNVNPTAYLAAYDNTKPVLQVGNDTGLVKGTKIRDLEFLGRNPTGTYDGAIGLFLSGGAYHTDITGIEVQGFVTNVKIENGATYPCSVTTFVQSKFGMSNLVTSSSSRSVYVHALTSNPASYCTAIYFIGCHFNGGNYGYIIENDGTDVHLNSTYIDGFGGHILLAAKTGSTYPFFKGADSILDLASSGIAVQNNFNSTTPYTDIVQGSIAMSNNGTYAFLDGTSYSVNGFPTMPYQSHATYPFIEGTLSFSDTSLTPLATRYTWSDDMRIYASNHGFNFEGKAGFQNNYIFGRSAKTEAVALKLNAGSVQHVITAGSDGVWTFAPAGNVRNQLSASGTWGIYPISGGSYFLVNNDGTTTFANNATFSSGLTTATMIGTTGAGLTLSAPSTKNVTITTNTSSGGKAVIQDTGNATLRLNANSGNTTPALNQIEFSDAGAQYWTVAGGTAAWTVNRWSPVNVFLDQPINISYSTGIVTIKDQMGKSSGLTRIYGTGNVTGLTVDSAGKADAVVSISSPYHIYPQQSSNPSTPSTGFTEFADSLGRVSWKRSDGYVRSFDSTLTADRVFSFPDSNTKFPIASQFLTLTGPTAARTITLPDSNFTAARIDAAQTFAAGAKQTFGADATNPGIALNGVTADPSSPANGIWLRTDTPALKYNDGAATRTILYSGGPLGTPSSGTLTNANGLPVATGISGLGTGVAAALATAVGTAGGFSTIDGAATLTNKTIDGASNTLQNLNASSITTGWTYANAPVGVVFAAPLTGVDLTSAVNSVFTIFTVPSGKTFVCTGGYIAITSATGTQTTGLTGAILNGSSGVQMTVTNTASTSFSATPKVVFLSPSTGSGSQYAVAGEIVKFKITQAQVGLSPFIGNVFATGFYFQ